jgi:S-adenosylmethionine synthetase
VDRSAAYALRWVAKNIVEARLARRCEVQAAYAIGVAEPVSIMVDSFGTGALADSVLEDIVREVFDLTPGGIIRSLHLKRPLYQATAAYGHFGRRPRKTSVQGRRVKLFPWEETSRVRDLLTAVRSRQRARR